jgi:peptidoglycan/LPS O-acetylase OafA/YrhL
MSTRGYMSQLDALRFFAIMGVIVAHNWRPGPGTWIFGRVWWGELGVRLFFVLSGFLITGILIGCRELAERNPNRRFFVIRQFYIRRFLRIFPIYYVVLIGLLIFAVAPARAIWPWLFTYTTNIYVWDNLHFPGAVGHFWTLAVEEQFYLVWPWLMLFLPRRRLVPVLIGFICISPLFRLYASFHYHTDVVSGASTSCTLTIGVIDSLSFGALLAILSRSDSHRERLRWTLTRVCLPVGVVGYAVLLAVSHDGGFGLDSHVSPALAQTAEALFFCWLVGTASRGFGGFTGRVLEWRPIAYLGKISYGIYIFHLLVPVAFAAAATRLGVAYHDYGVPNFVATSLVTFGIAALSWHVLEAPLNGLKRHFRYDVGHTDEAAPPVALPETRAAGLAP